jgi:hypothetical protein
MVIVSVDMVRSSALELLSEVRARRPGVRRVVLGGRAAPAGGTRERLGALADATLSSPLSPVAVGELVILHE